MADYNVGILGDFSGKVGPVVGSSWKGKAYMRAKARPVQNKKVSQAAAVQRAKFKLASDTVQPFKDLVKFSFQVAGIRLTARNAIMTKILQQAITGDYPNFLVDYSKMAVADGKLAAVNSATAAAGDPGSVKFTWTDNSNTGNAKATDKAILVAYCPAIDTAMFIVSDAVRSAQTAGLAAALFSGKQAHTWISFLNATGDVARSLYTGLVTVA